MEELESSRTPPISVPPCLSWDAFCNLLDDLPWEMAEACLATTGGDVAVEHISLLQTEFNKPGQYFFPAHSSRHACEVFWLKLCLFESLCSQVARYHERASRPSFNIDSRHVQVLLVTESGGYVPIRWRGTVRLPASPAVAFFNIEGMPAEMGQGLSVAPDDIDPAYLAPLIREWPHGRDLGATALIESIDPIPDEGEGGIRGLLRIHLITDSIVAKDFSSRDVFCIKLPLRSVNTGIRLWARKVDAPERGVVLSGVTDSLSQDAWRALEQDSHEVVSNARAIIYRSYSPACDVYGLGMLMLRSLLGSDSTQWNRLLSVLPSLVDGLAPAVQGVELTDYFTMHARVKEYLQEQGNLSLNQKVSSDLWWDAVLLGLRAISRIPGFSYEGVTADRLWSPADTPVEDFRNDVVQLANRARIELFESDDRDAVIVAACTSVLGDLGMT